MSRISIVCFSILFLAAAIAAMPSCNESGISSNREVVFPDSNVSFQEHVQPFLQVKCAYQGCHSAETRAGGRRMDDYFALFETYNNGLVIPGKPEESRIVQVMRRNPPHLGYRFPYDYFTENHIQGIITWIEEGAEFN